jgi:serine protease Do
VTDLTPDIARRFQVDEVSGVIVVRVEPGAKAAAAGVKKGDSIIEVNRVDVESVKEFKNLIDPKKRRYQYARQANECGIDSDSNGFA